MTTHPPITLQDLQVLNEEALKAEAHYTRYSYEDRDAMRAHQVAWQHLTQALVDWYRSGALQRLAELAEGNEKLVHLLRKSGAYTESQIQAARAPSVKEEK